MNIAATVTYFADRDEASIELTDEDTGETIGLDIFDDAEDGIEWACRQGLNPNNPIIWVDA